MPVLILAFVLLISKVLNLLPKTVNRYTFAESIIMKSYIYSTCVILVIIFGAICFKMYTDRARYKNLYERELSNVRAYETASSEMQTTIREFKFTIDELRSSNDVINKKLMNTVDSLKIKNKNIQYLQYNTSVIHKTDTIILQDTIFKSSLNVDTLIGDKWYNLKLHLKYPSTIITEPLFNSEKTVVISTKKEYDKKPSKIFFIRWFQKKHSVVTVDVIENNPYIDNKENRFIKVVKE